MDKAAKRLRWLAAFTFVLSRPRMGKRRRQRRDRGVCIPVPHDLVFGLSSADLHRHGGPVYPDADLFFPRAQSERDHEKAKAPLQGLHDRLLRRPLCRRDVGHAQRREQHDKRKHLARHPELRRDADDLPDILRLYRLHPPKRPGRCRSADLLPGLLPDHGNVRGAECF